MTTITKKDLIDLIADQTQQPRSAVKRTVQAFLDSVIQNLSEGKRLELRHFGVFEIKERAARTAQNPRTMQPIVVPARKTVKFKIGQLMRSKLEANGVTIFSECEEELDGMVTPDGVRTQRPAPALADDGSGDD